MIDKIKWAIKKIWDITYYISIGIIIFFFALGPDGTIWIYILLHGFPK